MATPTQVTTAEQLLAMSDDGKRRELIQGALQMMTPEGNLHGRVAMRFARTLAQHVRENKLGEVYDGETGFLLARHPDTVWAADAAFVSKARLAPHAHVEGYLPLAPDLVGEVVSPSDTFTQVEEKALAWLKAGSKLVLIIDPGTRTVHAYRSKDDISVLSPDDQLDANDVVASWQFSIGELFD